MEMLLGRAEWRSIYPETPPVRYDTSDLMPLIDLMPKMFPSALALSSREADIRGLGLLLDESATGWPRNLNCFLGRTNCGLSSEAAARYPYCERYPLPDEEYGKRPAAAGPPRNGLGPFSTKGITILFIACGTDGTDFLKGDKLGLLVR